MLNHYLDVSENIESTLVYAKAHFNIKESTVHPYRH
jgi:hypothetical protein